MIEASRQRWAVGAGILRRNDGGDQTRARGSADARDDPHVDAVDPDSALLDCGSGIQGHSEPRPLPEDGPASALGAAAAARRAR